MATIKALFAMANEELVETWAAAKYSEIAAAALSRQAKGTDDQDEAMRAYAEAKLETETIRLVISFRLMGRDHVTELLGQA